MDLAKFDDYRREALVLLAKMHSDPTPSTSSGSGDTALSAGGSIQSCLRYALSYMEGPLESFGQIRRILIGIEDLQGLADFVYSEDSAFSEKSALYADLHALLRRSFLSVPPPPAASFYLVQLPLLGDASAAVAIAAVSPAGA